MSTSTNFGGPYAQKIWSLVSGYPSEMRKARQIVMFQAYVDESAKGGYFVLAGHIAPVEMWARFSDEWAKLLNHGSPHFPRLEEFHMNEMNQSAERREMVPWFRTTIDKYASACFVIAINAKEMDEEFRKFQWPSFMGDMSAERNVFKTAFNFAVLGVTKYQEEIGIDEPIDWVFDQNTNKADCLQAWDMFREQHSSFNRLCGDSPIFRDSMTTLPLQAADLLAHDFRETLFGANRPQADGQLTATPLAVYSPDTPCIGLYVGGGHMRDHWEDIVVFEAQRRGIEHIRREYLSKPQNMKLRPGQRAINFVWLDEE